jgi:hypothetical protein
MSPVPQKYFLNEYDLNLSLKDIIDKKNFRYKVDKNRLEIERS